MTVTPQDALMIAAVLMVMLGMLWSTGKLSARFGIEPETKRKIVHVLTGLASLSFPWLFSNPLPVIIMIAASLVSMAALRSSLIKNHSMSTVLHDVQRRSYGEFYILISVGFLFARSVGNPVLYVLPLTVIALSDTASALIGTKYGKKRLAIFDGEKTIEGSVAFFTVTLLVSLILLMLLTEIPETNLIILSILIAGFCTFVESDSWKGLDNLFVPVGAHILLAQLYDASAIQLILALLMMAGAMLMMQIASPALKLTKQTSRAYTLLIILFVVGRTNIDAVFPLMAIIAHLFARKSYSTSSVNPDLEMIGVTAAVAMLWMFVNVFVPVTTLDLLDLTFAAITVIFIGLTLTPKLRFLTLPAAAIIGVIYVYTKGLNSGSTFWMQSGYPLPMISIGLAGLAVCLIPKYLTRYRALKSYALASIAPVLCCIFIGVMG